jgi:hypothetical protein
MHHRTSLVSTCLTLVTLASCAATSDDREAFIAQDSKPIEASMAIQDPAAQMEADMQACMLAGTPGEMHKHLAQDVGIWEGKNTMWMAPGLEPMESTSTMTIAMVLDGRYARGEMASEMPGMGSFSGLCYVGFDNVSQKFVGTWMDSMSTGIMTGTGELSKDGKTLTWNYTYNCPIAKKPATMRQVEKITGKDTKTLDMWGKDPHSGKEFQMMHIELTRKSS